MTSVRPATPSDYGVQFSTFAPTGRKSNPIKEAYERVKDDILAEQIKKKPKEERTPEEKAFLVLYNAQKIANIPTVMYSA